MSDTSTSPEAVETTPEPEAEAVPETSTSVRKSRARKVAVANPATDVEPETPVDAAPVVVVEPSAESEELVAPPTHQVIYVEAPKPFVARGNRGFGVLIAVLATIIYALVYGAIDVIVELANAKPAGIGFLSTGEFWSPVVAFLIGFIVLVLIVNRAGWAAHVIGSLVVGAFVYFAGSAGFLLFQLGQIQQGQAGAFYTAVLFTVPAVVAGLLGREVALWMGFAVAARGRKVKARNVDARAVYDQEIADKKAEYEAGVAPAA